MMGALWLQLWVAFALWNSIQFWMYAWNMKNINRVKWQNMIHDLCFFLAIVILGKPGWLGALVIFTFFRVICFDSKETLILLIVNPQPLLMIQDQSQEYLCNSIYTAITLVWKLEVPQITRKSYLPQSNPLLPISTSYVKTPGSGLWDMESSLLLTFWWIIFTTIP